jgi:uncharacterized metal-binding protein YceD (DUF177 family)
MSKLVFNIVEIPEGESQQELTLEPDDLDLSPYDFVEGQIAIDLYRTRYFIRVSYNVRADVELVCDRSLESFIHPVDSQYDVIFKTDVEQETEDEEGAVRKFNFSSNTLSIKEEVRDSIMLEVPIQKIHPKYLDENGNYKNFKTKSFGDIPEEADENSVDPRWEKLKKLKD